MEWFNFVDIQGLWYQLLGPLVWSASTLMSTGRAVS